MLPPVRWEPAKTGRTRPEAGRLFGVVRKVALFFRSPLSGREYRGQRKRDASSAHRPAESD
ncbi:hypothetical protein DB347_21140 [Opitutaceae bacterium EW11]|nr:hypothetical protein DB347_21140 [Opitutaceae bacterium EW11]